MGIVIPDFEVEKETEPIYTNLMTGDVYVDDNLWEEIVLFPETLPEFPGGEEARIKFLWENLEYPKTTRNLPSGRVFIGFIVEADGSLTNFEIVRSLDPLLDEEALRVAKLMPRWKAEEQKGKAVRASFNMPINFTVND
jgi:protein TonB